MEEPNALTIESLRARLLSQRSASKAERQRADRLAERVAELEKQLKVVSLQRRKAEKAATAVLAILADLRISHLSEGLDSKSEQDETPRQVTSSNGSMLSKETSANLKLTENESEAFSSSGFEYSPSTGRTLPWRNTKDSQHPPEKKTFMDLARKRAIHVSSGSSARIIGKSHRRIRRRETRSIDEFQNEGYENAACSRDPSNCSEGESSAQKECSENDHGEKQLGHPSLGPNETSKDVDDHYFCHHQEDGNGNVETFPDHPARLACHPDEGKKVQSEWEENIVGYNSGIQDSSDPANRSDVTEEGYEVKSPETVSATEALISDHQRTYQVSKETGFSKEYRASESSPSTANMHKGTLQNQPQRTNLLSRNSSFNEVSFPVSREQTLRAPHGHPTAWRPLKSIPQSVSHGNSSECNLAVAQEIPNRVASTLEELRQAKKLLNKESNSLALAASNFLYRSGSQTWKEGKFELPFVTSSVCRIPTDYELGETAETDARNRGSRTESGNPCGAAFESRRALSSAGVFRTRTAHPGAWAFGSGTCLLSARRDRVNFQRHGMK